jgi:hypothetical protein
MQSEKEVNKKDSSELLRIRRLSLTSQANMGNEELRYLTNRSSPWLHLARRERSNSMSSTHKTCNMVTDEVKTSTPPHVQRRLHFGRSRGASEDFLDKDMQYFFKTRNYCGAKRNDVLTKEQMHRVFSNLEHFRIYCMSNPNFAKFRDEEGNVALHHAVNRSDPNLLVVCELIKDYPFATSVKNIHGNLPLFIACTQNKVHAGVIRALLQAFPEGATRKLKGNLALHLLCYKGAPSPESVRSLVNSNPSAVSTPNTFGNLPLHYLCSIERPCLQTVSVRIIMEAYPAAVVFKNKVGQTPIDLALCRFKSCQDHVRSLCPRTLTSSLDEAIVAVELDMNDRTRMLLLSTPKFYLTDEHAALLKDLNFKARRNIFLVGLKAEESTDEQMREWNICFKLSKYCPGLWRNIVRFL